MIKIPSELEELAKIFQANKKTLYVVGGFVRDSYLNISSSIKDDIDICSSVQPKELVKMLGGTKFEVEPINEKLGVMAIHGKNRYEYATFRKEVYESESHIPDKVEFISSLEEDAKRRDFKINAIYYDILEKSYHDPLGGIIDLKNGEITTVRAPKIVFNDDPERILRLFRFACSMGLNIPDEEFFYAKQNSYKISFISKFRLRQEFEKLLNADQIYKNLIYTKTAHFRAMMLIGEIDAWKYILPAMDDMKKTKLTDKKGEKIYDHILNSLKNASPNIRLAVLLHDVGKVRTMEREKNFFGSKEFISAIVENNLGSYGLGYPKQTINKVIRIIHGYDFNNFCLASQKTVKKYILENKDIIEDVIEIKNVVKNESKSVPKKVLSAKILEKTYQKMLSDGTPFERGNLKINGNDIIELIPKIKIENIDDLLSKLLEIVSLHPKKNNKNDLCALAKQVTNSNRDYFLDE